MMKRTICLMLGVSLLSPAAFADDKKAGELTDPAEILRKADAAAKAVKAVKYDVVAEGTGAMKARVGKTEASMIFSGFLQGAPEKYIVHATVTRSGSTETMKYSGGADGDIFFVVDHQAKKAYVDIDPAVMGSLRRYILAGMMVEFVYATPFSDELNAKSQVLKGSRKIGGEDCYEVHVVYVGERAPEATWCFSKKDFLPRSRHDLFTMPGGQKGGRIKTITNLVVDPKLDKDVFKLKLPDGYTKTDDFAP